MTEKSSWQIGATMVAVLLAFAFSLSPVIYAIIKWHCWWFATAPACGGN